LHSSGLPTKFWAEAAACSSHISTVTPRKNKNKTPFELFFNMKPNVSYVRVFGCVAYYHTPKEKRGKLELPGKVGMIGLVRGADIEFITQKRNKFWKRDQLGLMKRSWVKIMLKVTFAMKIITNFVIAYRASADVRAWI